MTRHTSKLVALLVVAFLLSSCAALKKHVSKPSVAYQDYKLTNVSLQDASVNFYLQLNNPNPVAIPVKNISYAIRLHNRDLLQGKIQPNTRIPANGSTQITIPAKFNYQDVIGGVQALLKQHAIQYDLKGDIDLGLLKIPYHTSGEIPLPRLPHIKMSHIRLAGISLSGIELGLKLNARNPNAFPVKMDKLGFNLNLSNQAVIKAETGQINTLKANADTPIELKMKLGFSQVQKVLSQLKAGGDMPVSLDGQFALPGLNGKTSSIPFNWSGKVPVLN